MGKKLVAVAISGGVDSSTAALLLKKNGHEIIGLHMHLWHDVVPGHLEQHGKSKLEILTDKAEQVCHSLGIPLHVADLQNEFKSHVVDYFCQGYMQGLTPNPCIICNKYLKFGRLLDTALSLGADYLATGHYARINYIDNIYHLLKGVDLSKDQSYVLYTLKQDKIRHVFFPLGDYHKNEVRRIARQNNLPTAEEPSSQDICFIEGKCGDFLSRHAMTISPGEIVTSYGEILGRHKGILFYTVGQRHGLGLSASHRFFVIALDPTTNRVIVGSEKELYSQELTAVEVNWISGKPPTEPMEATVKIRYKSPEIAARLFPKNDVVKLQFLQSQRAVTPGQAVVFYNDNEVIGGGIIAK